MSNEQWEPVEDATVVDSAQNELCIYTGDDGVQFVESHTNKDKYITHYTLPDSLRLCRRVEPEPITAAALAREGWKCPIHHWIPCENYDKPMPKFLPMLYFFNDKPNVSVSAGGLTMRFPGVHTMQDLRTLVRFLGGGE